jgi:hypothetical protein
MAYTWGDTSQLGAIQGTQTMPIAGGFMDQLGSVFNSIPSNLPEDYKGLAAFGGMQNLFAQQNNESNRQFIREMFAAQKEAAKEANEMGIRNQVIGSFLKDVPAALGRAAGARNDYLPQQVEIAGRSMQMGGPGFTPRNYYGFVG